VELDRVLWGDVVLIFAELSGQRSWSLTVREKRCYLQGLDIVKKRERPMKRTYVVK